MASTGFLLVFCTCPAGEIAQTMARSLVEEQLAACVSIQAGVKSVYRWQGRIETAEEQLLLIKTRQSLFDQLHQRITQLHPYDVPEVIASAIEFSSPAYLCWLQQTLSEEA